MKTDPTRDVAAERAVAGAIVLDAAAVRVALERVRDPAAFTDLGAREVFLAARSLHAAAQPVDAATLQGALRRRGTLDEVGGASFLGALMRDVHTTAHVEHHVATLLERLKVRRLLAIGDKLRAADPAMTGDELADAVRIWLEAAEAGLSTAQVESEAEAYARALDQRGRAVPTGWPELDDLYMGGWWPGLVHVVAARTSNGKSTVVLNWAVRAVTAGVPVDVHAWELGRIVFLDLLASHATGRPKKDIISRWRDLTDDERRDVRLSIDPLVDAGLRIYGPPDEHGGPGWPVPASVWDETDARMDWFERQVEDSPARIVACDLFESVVVMKNRPNEWDKAMTRARRIADRQRRHLWLLHQVNRQSGEPEDTRPSLKHLKYSGALEEKAHIVTALYQPGVYRRVKRDTVDAEVKKQTLGGRVGSRVEWDVDWVTGTLKEARMVDTRRPEGQRSKNGSAMDAGDGEQDEIDF